MNRGNSDFEARIGSNLFVAALKFLILITSDIPLASSTEKVLNHYITRWPYSSKLSQGTILSVVQGIDNVLWMLTLDGITRFDGNDFLDFRPYKSGAGLIPSANVIQIIEDKFGEVYALTDDAGLLIYDQIEHKFVKKVWDGEPLLTDISLSTGFADNGGSVWIGGKNGEIFRTKPRLGTVERIDISIDDEVVDFSQSSDGSVFALTKKGSVFKFFQGTIEQDKAIHPCLSSGMELSAITALSDGHLWIGTRGNGLYKANEQTQSCYQLPLGTTEESEPDQQIIHDILYSEHTSLTWVTTDKGIYKIESEDKITRYYTENSGISDNWVISIAGSDRGKYWIGTYDGLNYVTPTNFEIFGAGQSSRIHSVVGIDSNNEQGFWVAMYDGLQYFDLRSRSHSDRKNLIESAVLKNNQIMSLNVDQTGIWVGYHSSGLEHYSFSKQEMTYYGVDKENKLSSNAVTKIVTTRNGEVLVGTYGGGLNIISEGTSIESISVGDKKVIMLHETNDGPVLVGTESGLFFYYTNSRKLHKVSFDYSSFSFFSEPLFWSVGESENGDLWLGSKLQGLFLWRMNQLTGRYSEKIIPLTQHWENLTIYALEIDDQGKVWMSTNSGLLSYNPSDNEIQTYSILYGLHKTKFDHGVSHKDFMGHIYFGGNSGYVRFDPSLIRLRSVPPPLSLTKIETASNPAGFNQLSPPASSSIELAYTDYFVKFTFSVLDFLDPDKNHYRYKLEGFDPEWIDNGTRNTATYTNLPAGNYVFRVQGANSAGIWNREGLSLNVEVLPAWWLTWWAYTFYALSLSFAVWVLMRWYHTYKVKESALETARHMHEVALRSEDDLQEQYEIQDRLLQSVFHHNTSTLKLVNDCIASQSHCISDDIYREAVEKSTRRVSALALLEDCIYHHGDTILADLKKYADKIISELLRDAPVPAETVTTINDISSRLLPVALGSPLAIIIFELLENSLHHAFEPGSSANYIHLVSTIERLDTDDHPELYALNIQDSGLGIPGNIDLSALETSGLAIVQSLVSRLSGKLQICAEGGTKVSVLVPIPRE